MAGKSIVDEAHQIATAIELIELGARLQVLEVETSLSRERLLRLYKEVKGVSPPKGMLPFSTTGSLRGSPTSTPRCSWKSTASWRRIQELAVWRQL